MERIHREYRDIGVEVLAVIQRADSNRLSRFKQEFKTSYTVLADPEDSAASLYAVKSNPTMLIIDKSGIVRYVGGFTSWTTLAEEIEAVAELKVADLSSVELAVQSLKAPESYIRWKAAKALGEMGDQSVVPQLVVALKDEAGSVRELATQALGEIGGDETIDPLITALEDKSAFVRLEAVKALGKVKVERAISPLEAVASMGKMKGERVIPPLVKCLADSELRDSAADALAEMNQPELVNKALEENSAVLRRAGDRDTAEAYSRLGRAYQGRGMQRAAIPVLKKAAELAPDSYYRERYVRSLADCYIETGETEKAAEEYLTLVKNSATGRTSVTMSYGDGRIERFNEREWAIRNIVDSSQRSGKIEELAQTLEAKLSESPQDAVLREMLASIYNKQGADQKSIPMYEKILELKPGNRKDYARLVSIYNRAGMRDKAIATAKAMAEKPAGSDPAYSLMATAYIECEMYDEAIAAYKNAVASSRGDWERNGYQFGLASCYEAAGKYAEAANEYEQIMKGSTDSSWPDRAERQLWEVYKKGDLYDVAIEKYQEMVKASPEDAKAYESLAKAYQGKGELEKAIAQYEKVTELKPDDARAFETLGSLYEEQGDSEKAIDYYREAARTAPDNNSLHEKLGDLYSSKGMTDEAIAEYDISQTQALASIKQGSTSPSVYHNLARFYIKKNVKPKEAISLAQEAVELAPDDPTFADTLGAAYLSDGQKEKAQQQWAKTGFVRDTNWLVVGPFDNTDGTGFSQAYPPEESINLHATYQGKDREIGWIEAKDGMADAYIDLNRIFDQAEWAAAYALARITSPEEREAQLRVGSDDDVKVWLNGQEILSENVARSVAIDQDIVPVNLKRGMNEILVKVCDRTVDWGFYLRITDMEGKPYHDLRYTEVADLYSLAR